jgi:hypothetical protein
MSMLKSPVFSRHPAQTDERVDAGCPSRTLTYSIQNDDHPLPFSAYVATLIVTPTGDKTCRVDWFSNFNPKGATEDEAIKAAQNIYTGAIKGVQIALGV